MLGYRSGNEYVFVITLELKIWMMKLKFLMASNILMANIWIFLLIIIYMQQLIHSQEYKEVAKKSKNDKVFTTVCFKNLGCFSNGPPFYDPVYRKNSVPPEEQLHTKYFLFTPSNPDTPFNLSLSNKSVYLSPFNANLKTKILIPGFLNKLSFDGDFIVMKDEILKADDANVIIIDWECSNKFPYNQAVANGRVVGAQIANLLNRIKKIKNMDYKSVHLIGHSLGAHVAGWTGERLNKIGRITGLDPAGPSFHHAPPPVRLDRTDAEFVDVIHTDAAKTISKGFGLQQSIGHLNFFPNNGSYQPVCHKNKNSNQAGFSLDSLSRSLHLSPTDAEIAKFILTYTEAGQSVVKQFNIHGCQHLISKQYFISSINKCVFLAVNCQSYEKFQKGECTKENSLVAEMGYHARKIKNIKGLPPFYLHTTAKPPYCLMRKQSKHS